MGESSDSDLAASGQGECMRPPKPVLSPRGATKRRASDSWEDRNTPRAQYQRSTASGHGEDAGESWDETRGADWETKRERSRKRKRTIQHQYRDHERMERLDRHISEPLSREPKSTESKSSERKPADEAEESDYAAELDAVQIFLSDDDFLDISEADILALGLGAIPAEEDSASIAEEDVESEDDGLSQATLHLQ